MQGFDPQTILPRIAAQGLERQEIRPGDWFDDDGMLMCGKCGEPRQGMVTVSAPMEGNPENKMTFKATRSCKCDRDKEAAEKQAEQNKKDMERVARLKKASLMDEKLREASFDSFQVTKYNARNLKLCRRYAEAFDEMVSKNQGLIFWGSVGTGKSFAAACIANHLLNRGVPVMMTSLVKLLELIQGGEEKESDIIARMNSAKLVIFDDLGAERNTDYALEKIYNIIDSRYRRKLPMLLTTNLTIDEMYGKETYYSFDLTEFIRNNYGTSGIKRQKLLMSLTDEESTTTFNQVIFTNDPEQENQCRLDVRFKIYNEQ